MTTRNDGTNPGAEWGALMAAAQAGDRRAYGALLAALTPALRRIVRSRLRGAPELVEDVLQEILVSVHLARASYDPARPFRPWLWAIARRRIADAHREILRRRRHEQEAATAVALTHPGAPRPDDGDLSRLIGRAIRALPETQRRAIELLSLEQLSLADASHRTGASPTALKAACHRARKRLRLALA